MAPLIGDGGQFSPGVPWANKAADIASKWVGNTFRGAINLVATPGAVMRPNPYPPGSEEAFWYEDQRQQLIYKAAPVIALAMLGTGAPLAESGAVGALGGKLSRLDSGASVADKLDRYLLNPDHIEGGPKANWLQRALGFTRENSADLAKQLVLDESQAVRRGVNEHGTLFNQTINVTGANGRTIPVTTGWIIGPDGVPRLTTALSRNK